jgi:predicted Zn-dependent peptidase
LLEHLLIGNGAVYENEEKLLHALQNIGAHINASTDYQYVTVHLRAPHRNFVKALEITFDCVFNAQITQESLDREREIVLREIHEQYDSMSNRAAISLLSMGLTGIVPESWESFLEHTVEHDLDTILQAYRDCINPKNVRTLVAGNLSSADQSIVEKMFRDLPSSDAEPPAIHTPVAQNSTIGGANVDLDGNAAITYIFLSPISAEKLTKNRIANNMAMQLLFQAPLAILPMKLRHKGLVYSVTVDAFELTQWRVLTVNVITDQDKAHIAAAEILRYLRLYAGGHIPAKEFESTRKFIVNNLSISCETVSDLLDWYAGDLLDGEKPDTPEYETKLVEEVTAEGVSKATQRLFTDAKLYGMVICDDAEQWTHGLNDIRLAVESDASEEEVNQSVESTVAALEQRRMEIKKQRKGWFWMLYWF